MQIRNISLLAFLFLAACATPPTEPDKTQQPLKLTPVSFGSLDGWSSDDMQGAVDAFRKSCARIVKRNPAEDFGPDKAYGTYGDWQPACRQVFLMQSVQPQAFFEQWFTPWQVSAGEEPEGLFTGYYEAALKGSRTRQGPYQTPLLKKPADLVMVNLGEFRDELKGQRIAGRVTDGYLKPYEDRAAIEAGKLSGAEPLVWVDDPVGAFFLHIQGSGRIDLDDGTSMRAGYDGQNGHIYYAVGRELVKRGEMEKEDVSMQSIRAWLEAHPDQAQGFMNLNKSYIFFRELKEGGPEGAEGIVLTPERSLAVDRTRIPYGAPLWVQTEAPGGSGDAIARLMVAQDTGGAITGTVRGDYFWGYGPRAEAMAGAMKSKGRYWILLPREK